MFVASERVIVCTYCKVAVPFQNLDTHLRVAHKLHFRTGRTIVAQFDGLLAAQNISDLEPRRDRSAPLSYIAPSTFGYTCVHCSVFKSIKLGQYATARKEKALHQRTRLSATET
jgi:hypothetical protein